MFAFRPLTPPPRHANPFTNYFIGCCTTTEAFTCLFFYPVQVTPPPLNMETRTPQSRGHRGRDTVKHAHPLFFFAELFQFLESVLKSIYCHQFGLVSERRHEIEGVIGYRPLIMLIYVDFSMPPPLPPDFGVTQLVLS